MRNTPEKKKRVGAVWLIIPPILGFISGILFGNFKLHDIPKAMVLGFMTAITLFIANWRWIRGQRYGAFSGDKASPSPEEDLNEAIRKMKERGEKI